MAFQKNILNIGQALLHRRCLGNDIDTINIFINHILETPDLPLDYFKPLNKFLFIYMHLNIIYPLGGICQEVIHR